MTLVLGIVALAIGIGAYLLVGRPWARREANPDHRRQSK
jgi:hypothetical protein